MTNKVKFPSRIRNLDEFGQGTTYYIDGARRYAPPWLHQQLVELYRTARQVWAENDQLRQAAGTIVMSEREYCDRYISGGVHVNYFDCGVNGVITTQADFDAAFEEAKP